MVSNADGLEPLAWLLAAAVVAGTAVLAARRRRAYLVAYLVGMLVWLVVLAGFLWWLSTQLTFTF